MRRKGWPQATSGTTAPDHPRRFAGRAINGIRLSGAACCHFRHRDMAGLEARLATLDAPRKLIVTASIYSLRADRAPLDTIVEFGRRHGAWIMLDDADGFGALGPGGRGFAHARDCQDAISVIMGVLSKSLAASGRLHCRQRQADRAPAVQRAHLRVQHRDPPGAGRGRPRRTGDPADRERSAGACPRSRQRGPHPPARDGLSLRRRWYPSGANPARRRSSRLCHCGRPRAPRRLGEPGVSPAVPRGTAVLQCCLPPTMTTLHRAYAAFEAVAADYRE